MDAVGGGARLTFGAEEDSSLPSAELHELVDRLFVRLRGGGLIEWLVVLSSRFKEVAMRTV